MLSICILMSLGNTPAWSMSNGGSLGLKTGNSPGFYDAVGSPEVRWTRTVPTSSSSSSAHSVVDASGAIYLSTSDHITKIPDDGSTIGAWNISAPCSTLALSADSAILYAMCVSNITFFQTSSGKQLATYPTEMTTTPASPLHLDSVSGLLLYSFGNSVAVNAMSATSGEIVWKYQSTTNNDAAPIGALVSNSEAVFVAATDGTVHMISTRFGTAITAAGTATSNTQMLYSTSTSSLIVFGANSHGALYVESFGAGVAEFGSIWKVGISSSSLSSSGNSAAFISTSVKVFVGRKVTEIDLNGTVLGVTELKTDFVVGEGMCDSDFTVYGSSGGYVNAVTEGLVEMAKLPLNCSAPQPMRGSVVSVRGGRYGTVLYVLSVEGGVDVVSIKRAAAEMVAERKGAKRTEGTPAALLGFWRGVSLQNKAANLETDLLFADATASLIGGAGTVQYTTAYDSTVERNVQLSGAEGVVSCVWIVLPDLPQTKSLVLSCSGANLPAPVSTEAALCGSNGSAVYSLIQCVVPAVQHPPCMFTPPTSRLRTHQCGEQCALFTDCPATCKCTMNATAGHACCGVCTSPGPTPAPTPTPIPIPTPTPGPTPPPAPPSPPSGHYICTDAQCVASDEGWNKAICGTVCGKEPAGSTPGSLVGRWTGLDIKQGYAARHWTFIFDSVGVAVYRDESLQWAATVQPYGAGLFFTFTRPETLLGKNVSALYALARTTNGTLVQNVDLAFGLPSDHMPYGFNEAMVAGMGQYALVSV